MLPILSPTSMDLRIMFNISYCTFVYPIGSNFLAMTDTRPNGSRVIQRGRNRQQPGIGSVLRRAPECRRCHFLGRGTWHLPLGRH